MAVKIGDLFFDVYADVSRAVKNIDDFTGKVQRAGDAAARAIGSTIANATALSAAGVGYLAGEVLKLGAEFNVAGQRSTAMFTALSGSLGEAQGILSDLGREALDNPIFDPTQLQRTSRMLLAYGIAADDVFDLSTNLNLMAMSIDGGTERAMNLARAIGQISAAGILQGDEARQLNEFLDVYGVIAEATGQTRREVRALGEEHMLLAEDVLPIILDHIEKTFGPVGQELVNTFAAQLQGLRTIATGVGAALVEPLIGFSGGGALAEAISAIRAQLRGMLTVAEDGSFVLEGFLAPLAPVAESVADGVRAAGLAIADLIGSLDAMDMGRILETLGQIGPLALGAGAALGTMFVQAIPFVGRFFAGLNPVVVGITALVLASETARDALAGAFARIWEAVQPLIPGLLELGDKLSGLVADAVPIVLDLVVVAVEELAPLVDTLVGSLNGLLPVLAPVLLEVLDAVADALEIILKIVGALPPEVVLLTAALWGLSRVLPIVTVGIAANLGAHAAAAGVSTLTVAMQNLVPAIAAATAAWGAFQAIRAAGTGDIDWLSRDVTVFEKPFQLAGRFGFALGGGDRAANQFVTSMEAAEEAAGEFNLTLLAGIDNFSDARSEAQTWAATLGLSADAAMHFANLVALAWKEERDAALEAEAARSDFEKRAGDFFRRRAQVAGLEPPESILEEIDLMDQLTRAADQAWDAVERLLSPSVEMTIDDFLLELPGLVDDFMEALKEPEGALRDLATRGVLNDARRAAQEVIGTMARDFGLSMDEIRAQLDERGLAAVIEALGHVTAGVLEEVDPLVARYSELGATADQLGAAVDRLESQRTDAIQAQIDSVSSALDAARAAADDAREALDRYFAGTVGGVQGEIDRLVLDIPKIGDAIEKGLLTGGAQGDAMVRQALAQAGGGMADVFRAGLEQGLSPQQIIDMLGPVSESIAQEVSGGVSRISTQDWTAGFTPETAAEIQRWMSGILDPGAISAAFGRAAGAAGRVGALEQQLKNLRAELRAEVEFTPAQVQEALDAIQSEVQVTVENVEIPPQAAQLIHDEILAVLDDNPLEARVNDATLKQSMLDASRQAEQEIALVFDSALSFDNAALHEVARMVSAEFYAAFTDNLRELRDQRAQALGFESADAMRQSLGPAVTNAMIGPPVVQTTFDQTFNIDGARDPMTVASEAVAASSAAAGSGGRYDPSKWYRGPIGGGSSQAV